MIEVNGQYPFPRMPLPYAYDALEPFLSADTLRLHYNGIYSGYLARLNKTLEANPDYRDWSLKALLIYADGFPPDVKSSLNINGGGVFNHQIYFNCMGEKHNQLPKGSLASAIDRHFGSYAGLKEKMKNAAIRQFASGWVWLTFDAKCTLQIIHTSNQEIPIPSLFHPLLCIDVWEHAYFQQYENRREEYVENWFRVVDWEKVEQSFACG